jgi:hypothetical protein
LRHPKTDAARILTALRSAACGQDAAQTDDEGDLIQMMVAYQQLLH